MMIANRIAPVVSAVVALQCLVAPPAIAFHEDPLPDPPPPFVICENQRYALCAAARCFVYNGVAYCQCHVERGNSISLQLDFLTPTGAKNVCDVNKQGVGNGFMVSTFSLPPAVLKGGPAAVYTCPGTANQGSGDVAPVAYGQCDGGLCFTSTIDRKIPGLSGNPPTDIAC